MGTVVITGANSGIGLGAARLLGRDGHRVVMAVRDTAKGERAAQSVDGGAEVRKLDLTDLASVRAFADGWDEPIDVLINNAGIMAVPFGRTKDGFELQVGTNHLGHFALTNLLLPHVRDRVVTVASVAHRFGGVDLADLNFERRRYDRWRAYAQSKLANLLFVLELQRRLLEADSDVLAVAAHPGYAATNLQSHTGTRIEHLVMKLGNALIGQSIEHGARPTVHAATQEMPPGGYAGPGGIAELWGTPRVVGSTSAARDEDKARGLWALSEELTGVTFPVELRRLAHS
jgi:NAD(P)-dependent dehydrogenase (short-subunit alcohol dehydrogenase family)